MEKRRSRLPWVVAGMLLLVGAAGVFVLSQRKLYRHPDTAQTSDAPPSTAGPAVRPEFMFPPGAERGGIEGRVIDEAGKPVPNAVVSIAPRLVGVDKFRDWVEKAAPRQVRADAAGHYQADDVAPGILSLTASAPHFVPGRKEPVKLLPGERLTNVDITVTAGGVRLFGAITDSGGGPIPGARVLAAGIDPKDAVKQDPSLFIVQTTAGDDGQYELYLAPQWYDVRVTADGYAADQDWVTVKTEQRHDVRLHPAARIVGRVLGADGLGVPEVPVRFQAQGGGLWIEPVTVMTGADGAYTSRGLDPGQYVVDAKKGADAVRTERPVQLGIGATVTVDLKLKKGLVVSGRVTDDRGKPIAGARLQAGTDGIMVFYGAGPPESPPDAITGADGRYTIAGLLGPWVRVTATAEGRETKIWSEQALKEDRRDVDFVLAGGARLLVTVIGPDKQPLMGATAQVEVGTPDKFETIVFRQGKKASGPDGKVELDGLPAGPAALGVYTMEQGSRRKEGLQLVAGKTLEVTVEFEAAAAIVGTVKWDDETPAPGMQVNAWGKSGGNGATTDNAGVFKIEKLGAGDYNVVVESNDKDSWSLRREPDPRSTAKVTLVAGKDHTGVALMLKKRDGSIEGIVLGVGDKPVAGAQVGATEPRNARFGGCGMAFGGKFVSDEQGHFKIDKLPKGVFGMCAAHPEYTEATVLGVATGARDVRLRLKKPGSIAGVLVDAKGQPVSKFSVVATYRQPEFNNSPFAEQKSDVERGEGIDGAFAVTNLKPAVWDVTAETPDGRRGLARGITVSEGAAVTGVRISLEEGVTLSGRLVHAESGAPLAGIAVETGWSWSGGIRNSNSTDAQGRYEVKDARRGMKVAIAFRPTREQKLLADDLEAWVPADSKGMDLGVFKLSDWRSEEEGYMTGPRTGLRVGHEGGSPVVTGMYEESPAFTSGVKVRDRVLAIDGKPIGELGPGSINRLLSGPTGNSAVVRVQTGNEAPRDVTIPFAAF